MIFDSISSFFTLVTDTSSTTLLPLLLPKTAVVVSGTIASAFVSSAFFFTSTMISFGVSLNISAAIVNRPLPFCSDDFPDTIVSAAVALSVLPVALELLFEDCVQACVQFLEAVPWSEDEENAVLAIIPLLGQNESRELLARPSPPGRDSSKKMLRHLVMASIGNQHNLASVKVKSFVARMLRDFPSRETVRRVFDGAFMTSLGTVKESLEKYSSPDFRGDHDETEAIQRLHLHSAVYRGKDLLWLVERMIELGIADTAVKEWSEQTAFVADLQRAFQDDAWRNIAPGLPALVLRCTGRLADTVAAGSILAARQVRLKLVHVWLPVLIVCREQNVSPIPSGPKHYFKNWKRHS